MTSPLLPPDGPPPATPGGGEQRIGSLEEAVHFLAAFLMASLRTALIYSPTHTQFQHALARTERMAAIAFGFAPEIVFICLDKELFVGGKPMNRRGVQFQKLADFMTSLGVQQLRLLPGLSALELKEFALHLVGLTAQGEETGGKCFRATPHIRAGRLRRETPGEARLTRQAITGLVASGAVSASEIADLLGSPAPEASAGGKAADAPRVAEVSRAVSRAGQAISDAVSRSAAAHEAVLGFLLQLVKHGGYVSLLGPLREHHEPTYLHSINVALLCAAQARALTASPELFRDILLAGLFHDLGKLAVPPAILDLTEPRGPEEERVYRGHCAAGAERLVGLGAVSPVVIAAAFEHHLHSRGGGGFPQERYCAQPHLASQIVALADFYDNARTGRDGRPARPLEVILTDIRKETLGRFHPLLAASLPKALREFEPFPSAG
jgi:HD-GYP domain-containing protein (c-di-GMP phosphodiesterase class II)